MLILGINHLTNWLQITTENGRYTCPTKTINGELFFRFKKEWHKVIDYVSEYTTELISKNGETISRPFMK